METINPNFDMSKVVLPEWLERAAARARDERERELMRELSRVQEMRPCEFLATHYVEICPRDVPREDPDFGAVFSDTSEHARVSLSTWDKPGRLQVHSNRSEYYGKVCYSIAALEIVGRARK